MAGLFGGGAIDVAEDLVLANVANGALMTVWGESLEGLNGGQRTIAQWHVIPAMQDAVLSDPEGFDSGTLQDAAYASHYAAFDALSETIENAADAAEDARDNVQDALSVIELVV
jgi:hypothetical protein